MADNAIEKRFRGYFEAMQKNPQEKQKIFMAMIADAKKLKLGGGKDGDI